MLKHVLWPTLFAIFAALIQSTIIPKIPLFLVIPDIALCIISFNAYNNGSIYGQLSGFLAGIFIDFLSIAPLGLNALIYTATGMIFGLLKGRFYRGTVVIPIILCFAATIVKYLIFITVSFLIPNVLISYSLLFSSTIWLELLYNCLLAPIFFLFFNLLSRLINRKKGIHDELK